MDLCEIITILDSVIKGLMTKLGFCSSSRKKNSTYFFMIHILKLLSFSSVVQTQNNLVLPYDLFQKED